jgi:hypothetical protein
MSISEKNSLPNVYDVEKGIDESNEGIPDRHHQRRSNIQLHHRSCCSWDCFFITLVSAMFIAMQVTVVTMMLLAYDNFATDGLEKNSSSCIFLLLNAIFTSVFSFLIILFFPLSIAYESFKVILSSTIFVYTLAHFALGITFIVFFFTKPGWNSSYLIVVLIYYFSGLLKCFFANQSSK